MSKKMLFGHHILDYQEEMLNDIKKLMSIPSVCNEPSEGHPFGEKSSEALHCILSMAERMGFPIINVGNYAGDARYGNGTEFIDVMTHVDVVPAGEGWNTDPYALTITDGMLYGRGIADDKGAALVALYCMKALKDAGITGNYCLRTVFGCGEEIGSNDLDIYYKEQTFPVMGFTPDCSYGVCSAEKGIYHFQLTAAHPNSSVIKGFEAGEYVNSVPAKAKALIQCSEEQYLQLLRLAQENTDICVSKEQDFVCIHSNGKASHAAEPELGSNAASKLICLLAQVFSPEDMGPLFAFGAEKIRVEYNGASLGLQMQDEPSGPLTINLGIISIKEGNSVFSFDMRFPVTKSKEEIVAQLEKAIEAYPIAMREINCLAPLYLNTATPLVSTLSQAYESVTGKSCHIYSTGGGTYARHSNNACVAFGPIFTNTPSNAHGPNEHVSMDHFLTHAQICLEAMYRLFTLPKN